MSNGCEIIIEYALGLLPETIIHGRDDTHANLVIRPRSDIAVKAGHHAWSISYDTPDGASVALEAGTLLQAAIDMKRWLNEHEEWFNLKELQRR